MSQKRKQITNHRQIERIEYIHKKLINNTYPTTEELADKLECSVSTISRDLEFMRDRCNAPYEYDQQRRGLYYTDPNYKLQFSVIHDQINADVAEDINAFAEYFNYPIELLNNLEQITNLNLNMQTQLKANLSAKYIGRSYFDDEYLWIGLKAFNLNPTPMLTIAFFEPYSMYPKEISSLIQVLIYNKSSNKFPTRIPIFSNRNSMEFAHK